MKFGVFTDPHYCLAESIGERKPQASFEKIQTTMEAFKSAGVELCFCLGDLTDVVYGETKEQARENLEKVMGLIFSYQIPFFLVPGNHDYVKLTGAEIEGITGRTLPPYSVRTKDALFVLLDGNYRSDMRRFDEAGSNWLDCNLPQEQIEFLKSECQEEELPCVILIHENLDPNVEQRHLLKNAKEVRAAIADCNKVKLVLQGHYHLGGENIVDGIKYVTLPAMCEKEKDFYVIYEI